MSAVFLVKPPLPFVALSFADVPFVENFNVTDFKGSPVEADMIEGIGCDKFGHEPTSSPWNKTLYEASPLNRVTGTSGPGAWEAKPTSVSYQTNTAAIAHWDAAKNAITFPANSLYLTETTDEDGNKTREYKDKLGQVVRKESYDGTAWLRTAYVYDDFGQLVIVVPPKAASASDAELCYYYAYDQRHRMTMKDLPGAEPVYMVYDNRDRLALSQDGVQRPAGKWSFTKYDALNRPVLTGEVVIADIHDNIATQFKNFTGTLYETTGTALYGYTSQSYPATCNSLVTADNILTVTYYDGYDFRPSQGYEYQSNLAGEPSAESAKTKGLVTGSFVKVLPTTETLAKPMALTVNYYDDYGRLVQTVADNHLEDTSKEVTHTVYNFAGQPVKTVAEHRKGNATYQQTLVTSLAYDHQGRLLTTKMKINSDNEITLSSLKYNELGEVIARYLHGDASGSNFNQQVDYTYNPKGWLRTINTPASLGNDLMALDLRYNSPQTGTSLGGTALFNGNISQMMWASTGSAPEQAGYGFTYDGLNRLRSANYAEGTSYTSGAGKFSTTYSYDDNGNMSTLTRNLDGNPVDNLVYAYISNGNRLQSVVDNTTDAASRLLGYKAVTGSYLYDNNGNMVKDISKGFTIAYNSLNLPQLVSSVNDYARYTYDAAGAKLAKTITNGSASTVRTDYSGPFMYENSVLKCIFTPEGRIVPLNSNGAMSYSYEYNLKDHLGNTRVTFTGHGYGRPEVNLLTSYDPYGLVTSQTSFYPTGASKNKLLYNGKEFQDDVLAGSKIDWFDYGARMYDPELGRWHSPESYAELVPGISVYAYCYNNPLNYTEPDGRWPSKWPINYHKIIITQALNPYLGHGLTKKQLETIITAGEKLDEEHQSAVDSYMHSMRNGCKNQSVEDARQERDKWVNGQILRFQETGDYNFLGNAIHTMSDEFAPSHSWKPWYGQAPKYFSVWQHVFEESNLFVNGGANFAVSMSLVDITYKKAMYKVSPPSYAPAPDNIYPRRLDPGMNPIPPIPWKPQPVPLPTPRPVPLPQPPVPMPPLR